MVKLAKGYEDDQVGTNSQEAAIFEEQSKTRHLPAKTPVGISLIS